MLIFPLFTQHASSNKVHIFHYLQPVITGKICIFKWRLSALRSLYSHFWVMSTIQQPWQIWNTTSKVSVSITKCLSHNLFFTESCCSTWNESGKNWIIFGKLLFCKERDLSRPLSGIVFDFTWWRYQGMHFVTFINKLNHTVTIKNHFKRYLLIYQLRKMSFAYI